MILRTDTLLSTDALGAGPLEDQDGASLVDYGRAVWPAWVKTRAPDQVDGVQ